MKIAAIQMTSTNIKTKNLKTAKLLLDKALKFASPKIILLPELFSYLDRDEKLFESAEDISGGEAIDFCCEYAKLNSVFIGGSILLKAESSKATNSFLIFSNTGEIVARYDKIHLFDVEVEGGDVYRESITVEAGKELAVFDLDGFKFGLTTCYDLRFPEIFRKYACQKVDAILFCAAFTQKTGKAHFETLLKARAIENQAWLIISNQFGKHMKKRESFGHSMVIDPWGDVKQILRQGEGIIYQTIDKEIISKVRKNMPCLEHIKFDIDNLNIK
ncbi:MAG: carbon-nitrogen hydrolase family protein [Pseudomonadota bacterium]